MYQAGSMDAKSVKHLLDLDSMLLILLRVAGRAVCPGAASWLKVALV